MTSTMNYARLSGIAFNAIRDLHSVRMKLLSKPNLSDEQIEELNHIDANMDALADLLRDFDEERMRYHLDCWPRLEEDF